MKPRLPLWSGKPLSLQDLQAASEALMSERDVQRRLLGELNNPLCRNGFVLAFHVPNGFWLPGVSAKVAAKIWKTLQRDGARPGAADLVVCHEGRVLFLELKRASGGVLSEDQKNFRDDCARAGIEWREAKGLSEARRALVEFGALRG